MKGTDLALVELDTTLGDLAAQGIRPLRLASSSPEAGRAVFWTGISGSPIPPELQFLRLGHCSLGHSVQLLEGSWIWNADLSNNCPDLYAGASGSPLFDAETSEIIGVISTSTILNFQQGPDFDCQVNRPCVIRAGGPAMQRDTSYAAPVQNLAQCFDRANALDPQRPGCPLDPGVQLDVHSGANEVRPEVDGKFATWDAAMRGNQPYYAYKRFRAGEDTCGSLAGYSPAILVAEAPVISDPIGAEDGYYFLCVISGSTPSFDSSWQQPSHASIRFKRIDSQPPLVPLDYEIEVLQNAYQLVFLGPEGLSDLGFALEKRGSPTPTDCSNPQGYRIQISIPDVVKTSDFPTRICVKTSDKAGNFADPTAFDFGPPTLLPKAVRNAASLQRGGGVAPGSVFRVDTFNLTNVAEFSSTPVPMLAGVQMSVLDQTGQTFPVPMTTAGPLFTEGVMPDAAAPGMATVIVQPPQGPSISQAVTIARTAPGLYSDHGIAVPSGFALDSKGNVFPLATCLNQSCFTTHLPVSSTPGGFDFVLYCTGFHARRGLIRLRIGTHTLKHVKIHQHPNIAGVDELHFHIPQDFPLRLFQTIMAETPDGDSNYLWIYLE